MNISAIIFDLGGVVFDCSFDRTFEVWAKIIGRHPDEIKRQFKFSENFKKFERNDITPKQFMDSISKQLHHEFSEQEFEEGWNSIYLDTIGDINRLLSDLSKNYRLIALTNTNAIHAKIWPVRYASTLCQFERIFTSHEMKARKPDEKAFRTVLDYLNLPPDETIFLDDKEEYIKGAIPLGINTILVNTYDQMLNSLKSFGIKAKSHR